MYCAVFFIVNLVLPIKNPVSTQTFQKSSKNNGRERAAFGDRLASERWHRAKERKADRRKGAGWWRALSPCGVALARAVVVPATVRPRRGLAERDSPAGGCRARRARSDSAGGRLPATRGGSGGGITDAVDAPSASGGGDEIVAVEVESIGGVVGATGFTSALINIEFQSASAPALTSSALAAASASSAALATFNDAIKPEVVGGPGNPIWAAALR